MPKDHAIKQQQQQQQQQRHHRVMLDRLPGDRLDQRHDQFAHPEEPEIILNAKTWAEFQQVTLALI